MKTRLIISIALVSLLSGCELIKNATTIDINTSLTANVPVVVTVPTKSGDLKGETVGINFTKSQDLTLASNTDFEPYLQKIKEINLNSLIVTVNGLESYQTIYSISLDVTGVGNIFTQTNITMSDNSFTPSVTDAILEQVATKLMNEKLVTLTLSGSVSGALSVTVSLDFDTTFKAGLL